MNQLTSKQSGELMNSRTDRLKKLITKNPDGLGLLADAKLMNNISYELCTMRQDKGLTQKQLAEILGVKQSNISRWERPGYQGYKVNVLSKLARVLGGQLQVSLRPSSNVRIDLDRFHYVKETHKLTRNDDGSSTAEHSLLNIKYEGVKIHANA